MSSSHLNDGRSNSSGQSETVRLPRILIGATGSGCGKTTFVCGLLRALVNRGLSPVSFKCGPDYIDPMFHTEVLGLKSRNLDLFFNDSATIHYLLQKNSVGKSLAVMEGVMGYYDGLGAVTAAASSWDLAVQTATPAILLVDTKGKSYSVLAEIKGFLSLKENSGIRGIILNRLSPMLYPGLKSAIEAELPVQVLGYVPVMNDCSLESRHLGLVTAKEVKNLQEILDRLAEQFAQSVDLDGILALAESAVPLRKQLPPLADLHHSKKTRVAIAQDNAFCFYYQDNLDLLTELGLELAPFSPLTDQQLPDNVSGLILGGGYPELYLPQLAENQTMLASVRAAVAAGTPCFAECGGFMYLHEEIEGQDGVNYAMVGAIAGRSFPVNRLVRFGYINLTAQEDNLLLPTGARLRGHEFHHWDSTDPGTGFLAEKPVGARRWECIRTSPNLFAGYPHIHFYANPLAAKRFAWACWEFSTLNRQRST